MGAQFWLWLGTIAMLAGGFAILGVGKRRTGHEQAHTIYHGVVPIIAACSYFAMAVGQGSIILPLGAPEATGRLFYYARYIDRTFTTPLLEENKRESATVQSDYRRNAVILSVVWLVYPLVLAASTDGLGVIGTAFSVALIAIVDLIAKVVYGLMTTMSVTKLVGEEEGAASVGSLPQRMAA